MMGQTKFKITPRTLAGRLTQWIILTLLMTMIATAGIIYGFSKGAMAEEAAMIGEVLPQVTGSQENSMQEIALETPQSPVVYLFDMPSSRQTIIGTYHPLPDVASDRDKTCLELWGEYFGGGMSSVLFQEVREFRSMAYAAQGVALKPLLARSATPCGYLSIVATQADKSMQAIALLDSLFNDMPVNLPNLAVARQSLLNDVNNTYPTFRGMPLIVSNAERMGYSSDKNTALVKALPGLTQADVEAFYRQHIQHQPYQLMIVGNAKKLDLKALARYGTIVRVQKDDIFKTKPTKKKKQ